MVKTIRVYKSGGEKNEYLITLDVDLNDTTLDRKSVVNRDTAGFRCRKAFVVEIRHKDTEELVESIRSNFNPYFIYNTGTYVTELEYDYEYDIDNFEGIHFFITKEPALLYHYTPKKYNNRVYKSWHNNGRLGVECEYKNGVQEGPCKLWYDNGQLWIECEYKNGLQEGPCKSWRKNGTLWEECEYKNDKLEGPFKSWYENGQFYEEGEYKNGKKRVGTTKKRVGTHKN